MVKEEEKPHVQPAAFTYLQQPRNPPNLSGKGSELAHLLLKDYSRVAAYNGWDESMCLANVVFFLEGAARCWFDNVEESITTWNTFKEEFTRTFGDKEDYARRIESSLKVRAQKPDESVELYIQDVLNLCRQLNPNMSEEDRVGHLMKGVAENIYRALLAIEVTTTGEFTQHCRRIEKLNKNRISNVRFERIPTVSEINENEYHPLKEMIREIIREELRSAPNELDNLPPPQGLEDRVWQRVEQNLAPIDKTPVFHSGRAVKNFRSGQQNPGEAVRRKTDEFRTRENIPICFYCNRPGHVAKHCWDRRRDRDENEPTDREKTAFITPDGLFEFKVMPFGLCNAPRTFERMMDNLLKGLRWTICLCYLDDVFIFADNFPDHLRRLEVVLNCFKRAGLKLNPGKCYFGASNIKILGHQVDKDGIRPDDDKIKAVSQFPIPKNLQHLRSSLGLSSYYRRFIKNYADIARPLNSLLSKGTKFQWNTDQERAFQKLKNALTSKPVLGHFDDDAPTELHTDASGYGIGAVLARKKGNGEKVIAYASRTLLKSEKNYSTTERECLAIVWAIGKFRPYLFGRPFKVITDHHSLCWLTNFKDLAGRLASLGSGGAQEIAKFLLEEVILKHGAPREIVMDRGRNFQSRLIQELTKNCHIKKKTMTAYLPQTNGLTEKLNRTIADMLSMYMDLDQKNWKEMLPFITFAYNTARQESTGFTPFFLVHGREAETTLDTIFPYSSASEGEEFIQLVASRAEEGRQIARHHIFRAQETNKLNYDARHKGKVYQPGDLVWIFTPIRRVGLSEKLLKRYFGPYKYFNLDGKLRRSRRLQSLPPLLVEMVKEEEKPHVQPAAFTYLQQPRNPPNLSGKGSELAHLLLKDYSRVAAYNGWDESMCLANVVFFLEGAARCWFDNVEESITTWNTFKEEFTRTFGDKEDYARRIESSLKVRAQKPDESVELYIQDVLNLCRQLNPNMSEEDRVGHLMKGVAENIYRALLAIEVTTTGEFTQHCRRIEKLNKNRISNVRFERIPTVSEINENEYHPLKEMIREIIREELRSAPNELDNLPPPQGLEDRVWQRVEQNLAPIDKTPVFHSGRAVKNFRSGQQNPGEAVRRKTDEFRTRENIPICFYCNRPGHVAKHCWDRRRDRDENEPTDREKTAFITPDGLFEFKVMPFGLCNAPRTFERMMDNLLKGLRWTICLCYLDDVFIFADNFPDHLRRLEVVLNCFKRAGLKLNPGKCYFGASNIKILGHQVDKDGIRPDDDKIKAVSQFPIPKNLQHLRSSLGLSSYYRRFIKNYADIARPLNSLLSKGTKFQWNTDQERAFQKLKNALTSKPVLGHFDDDAPTELHTDASGYGIGAVLARKKGNGEKVIAYASRTLLKSEKNYSTTERECLAIVWAIGKFRPYLFGRPFKVITDHHSLCWLTNFKDLAGRLASLGSGGAQEIAKFLLEEVILKHGAPREIVMDRGRNFQSRLIQELTKNCHIKKKTMTAYLPQTNGLTEKLNRTIADMLSMYMDLDQKNWKEMLPFITFAYNTARQESTGFTPFFLVHGREAETTLDTIFPYSSASEGEEFIQLVASRAEEGRQIARHHIFRAQETNKLNYDARHKGKVYQPGDLVWIFTPIRRVGLSEKLLK
ncbi:K02A2.6-like, partial [Cordylochernes scorpioides]